MTVSYLHGHLLTAGLFKCDYLFSYAALDEISTDISTVTALLLVSADVVHCSSEQK